MIYLSHASYGHSRSGTAQPYSLDTVVHESMEAVPEAVPALLPYFSPTSYRTRGYAQQYARAKQHVEYFSPEPFLNPLRPSSRFIGSAAEIREHIEEAFEKTTGKKLPEDLIISIVPKEDFKEKHADFNGNWNDGIVGFSVNNKGFGKSLVLVKENDMDKALITVGHEIGHVLSFTLPEKLGEEAKAFAFEMAWLQTLYEHNIANLKNSLNMRPQPARNGLHDRAFGFVLEQMQDGVAPLDLFHMLSNRSVRCLA